MRGLVYRLAIFLALLSAVVNPLAQLQSGGDRARRTIDRSSENCESCDRDRNGDGSPDDRDNDLEELREEVLREPALLKAFRTRMRDKIGDGEKGGAGATKERAKGQPKDDRDASRRTAAQEARGSRRRLETDDPIVEAGRVPSPRRRSETNAQPSPRRDRAGAKDVARETEEADGESGDAADDSNRRESVNGNEIGLAKGKPRYRSLQSVDSPAVNNRINAPGRRSNSNMNVNKNVNQIIGSKAGRPKSGEKADLPAEAKETGGDEVHADSGVVKIQSPIKSRPDVEGPIVPGSEDSVEPADTDEARTSSTSERPEVVAAGTTPGAVEGVDDDDENDDTGAPKKLKTLHSAKGRFKGTGKRHKKRKSHQKERRPSEEEQNDNNEQPIVSTTETAIEVSTVSSVEDVGGSTEPAQPTTTDGTPVEETKPAEKGVLTKTIMKLLIIKRGKMSPQKMKRLQGLLDQLNVDDKVTILNDLEKEPDNNAMSAKLLEKDGPKRVIISELKPKTVGRSPTNSSRDTKPPVDRDDNEFGSSNTPGNDEDTKNETETGEDDAKTKRSQEVAAGSSAGSTADDKVEDTKSGENKSTGVGSTDGDQKSKGIPEEARRSLRKPKARRSSSSAGKARRGNDDEEGASGESSNRPSGAPKTAPKLNSREEEVDEPSNLNSNVDTNVNSNVNVNRNRLAARGRRRMAAGGSDGRGDAQDPRLRESDVTVEINDGSTTADENTEIKSRTRNRHGQYRDRSQQLNTNKNSNVNSNKLSRRNGNDNVNTNSNVNKINVRSASAVDGDSGVESTRRSSRRLPERRNGNRNINSNSNINSVKAPVSGDYDEYDEVRPGRRNLDRSPSENVNSNSNTNVNELNRKGVNKSGHRNVQRRGSRKDDVKGAKDVDGVIRDASQVRKDQAEKEEDVDGGGNLENRRSLRGLHKPYNDRAYSK